jgi:hypothetical protein
MMGKKPKSTAAAHSRRALFGEVEEAGGEMAMESKVLDSWWLNL